jgi:WD40 repeat protein
MLSVGDVSASGVLRFRWGDRGRVCCQLIHSFRERAAGGRRADANWVRTAAFGRDGRRVTTASDDCTGRLWDAETGTEIAVLKGHQDRVFSAAFSPDGRRVMTASVECTARLWMSRGARPSAKIERLCLLQRLREASAYARRMSA